MQKPIATWSQLLDCWMSENQKKSRRKKIGLYEHLGVFSETLPNSGTMRNGKLYPPQKPEHPTAESEYSSSPGVATLPTPRANDHTGGVKNRTDRGFANQLNDLPYLLPTPMASPSGNTPEEHLRKKPGREVVTDLAIIAENDLFESGGKLLPTPRTTDAGGPGIHGNGGQDLRTEISLLPTPVCTDANGTRNSTANRTPGSKHKTGETLTDALLPTPDAYAGTRGGTQPPEKRRAGGHAVSVADVAEHELLPTPKASDGPNGGPNMRGSSGDLSMPSVVHQADFGKYAGAIARWAKVLGRPAPEPTEPGTKPGKRRLSALFVEWMMGQPEGRVTDPELGLSRTQQIKALGNGVVTQQAEIALGRLMERMPR